MRRSNRIRPTRTTRRACKLNPAEASVLYIPQRAVLLLLRDEICFRRIAKANNWGREDGLFSSSEILCNTKDISMVTGMFSLSGF